MVAEKCTHLFIALACFMVYKFWPMNSNVICLDNLCIVIKRNWIGNRKKDVVEGYNR